MLTVAHKRADETEVSTAKPRDSSFNNLETIVRDGTKSLAKIEIYGIDGHMFLLIELETSSAKLVSIERSNRMVLAKIHAEIYSKDHLSRGNPT